MPNYQLSVHFVARFHAIYWPALLMAAGLEPPRRIHVHSHWLINREKVAAGNCKVVII